VGPHHRAVLCNGVVIAIAEDTASASAIVRTRKQAPRDRHNLQALREKVQASLADEDEEMPMGFWQGELQEVLNGKSE